MTWSSLQAQGLTRPFVTFPTVSWERSYQFRFGCSIFLVGLTMNIRSDNILRQLRQLSLRKQHSIPNGEMFYYVSNPHYLGEIIEWIGYCIASNYSLSSIAFVTYTMANLIPRAITNHLWYLQHFPTTYPKLNRKAIIPFIW
jgi:3-oxo-5-alpha-steroid 4-dehydrogenase 1